MITCLRDSQRPLWKINRENVQFVCYSVLFCLLLLFKIPTTDIQCTTKNWHFLCGMIENVGDKNALKCYDLQFFSNMLVIYSNEALEQWNVTLIKCWKKFFPLLDNVSPIQKKSYLNDNREVRNIPIYCQHLCIKPGFAHVCAYSSN